MASITGVLSAIYENDTAYGKMYNISVEGVTYGIGKEPPKAKAGDTINFEATQKGRFWNVAPGSIKVSPSDASAPPQQQYAKQPAASNQRDATQHVISKQAARNSAIAFLQAAVAAGAGPKIPAKGGFSALLALCDELTEQYYNYAMGIEPKPEVYSEAPAETEEEDEAAGGSWG